MLNLRKPSLRIGLMILAFCGSALDAGSLSTAFAVAKNPEIAGSSVLTFETLLTDSPIQVAQGSRQRSRKVCSRCQRCQKSPASRRQKENKSKPKPKETPDDPDPGYIAAPQECTEEPDRGYSVPRRKKTYG